jgi:hypothetical protein
VRPLGARLGNVRGADFCRSRVGFNPSTKSLLGDIFLRPDWAHVASQVDNEAATVSGYHVPTQSDMPPVLGLT